MFIYVIRNKINGKEYVGQTSQSVRARFMWHTGKSATRLKTPLANAIKKYGRENFNVRMVEECKTREELGEAEARWIMKLDTLAPHGYNIRPGGYHAPMPDETRLKISIAGKGRTFTHDRNAKISRALKGRKLSIETRKRISMKAIGRKLTPDAKRRFIEAGQLAIKPPKTGENNGNSTLTWDKVQEIRARLLIGCTQQSLAIEYGVKQAAISRISLHKTWWPEPLEEEVHAR
jgi:group I intron endonuclease